MTAEFLVTLIESTLALSAASLLVLLLRRPLRGLPPLRWQWVSTGRLTASPDDEC